MTILFLSSTTEAIKCKIQCNYTTTLLMLNRLHSSQEESLFSFSRIELQLSAPKQN